MTLKTSPRKNHSQAFLPVFCAHSAQKAPKITAQADVSVVCVALLSFAETRVSRLETCLSRFEILDESCAAATEANANIVKTPNILYIVWADA